MTTQQIPLFAPEVAVTAPSRAEPPRNIPPRARAASAASEADSGAPCRWCGWAAACDELSARMPVPRPALSGDDFCGWCARGFPDTLGRPQLTISRRRALPLDGPNLPHRTVVRYVTPAAQSYCWNCDVLVEQEDQAAHICLGRGDLRCPVCRYREVVFGQRCGAQRTCRACAEVQPAC